MHTDVHPYDYRCGQDAAKTCDNLLSMLWFRVVGESLISGVTGEDFLADIYIGPVYYQRLRHMVSDKFQVGLPHTLLACKHCQGTKAGILFIIAMNLS